MTRVLVDALSVHFGGGGTVALEQLAGLARCAPDLALRIVCAPWNASAIREVTSGEVVEVAVRDDWRRTAFSQTRLPRLRGDAQVLYCPGNAVPLVGAGIPSVVMMQNPNFFGEGRHERANQTVGRRSRATLTRLSVRRADVVVAVSSALRDDIVRDIPSAAARVTTVVLGRPELPAPTGPPSTWDVPADRSWCLVLANDAPHKRIDLAVRAWTEATSTPGPVGDLVLAGTIDPARQAALRAIVPAERRHHLHLIGPVHARGEVAWLLQHASALVAASSNESFGLTLIEAGSMGCPLAVTDIPAHREVATGHAVFAGRDDAAALAATLREAAAGPRRDWRWPITWDRHAETLAAILRAAAA